jgi:hypothetical protein
MNNSEEWSTLTIPLGFAVRMKRLAMKWWE